MIPVDTMLMLVINIYFSDEYGKQRYARCWKEFGRVGEVLRYMLVSLAKGNLNTGHFGTLFISIKGKAPPKDEEYKKIWKKNQDGKVVNSQPMNVSDDRNAVDCIVNITIWFYPL